MFLRLRLLSSSSRITLPLPLRLLVLLALPQGFPANHSLLLPKDPPSTRLEHFRLITTHPRPRSSQLTTACLQPPRPQGVISPVLGTPRSLVPPLPPGLPTPMPETDPLLARATPSQALGIGKRLLVSPQHLATSFLCLQHISPQNLCLTL